MSSSFPPGLYLVGTPIGNMGDISTRAVECLDSAVVIVCEDTRRATKLLAFNNIASKPLLVANEHSEYDIADRVVEHLDNQEVVAVTSDAGMPTISDPGAILVGAAVEAGHVVDVVPGPTAVSSALAVSGFGVDRHLFMGFIEKKGRARGDSLALVASTDMPVVIYVGPHNLLATLADLEALGIGDRRVVICRELTKLHSETIRGTVAEVRSRYEEVSPRGEFVVVLGPAVSKPVSDGEVLALLRESVDAGESPSSAVRKVTDSTGVPKNTVYRLLKQLKQH